MSKEHSNYDRHKGDDLLSKDKRLKYHWEWHRSAARLTVEELRHWTHFQCSYCSVGDWELEVSQWSGEEQSVYYEVVIHHKNTSRVASTGGDGRFKTRIDAQIAAECFLRDWIKEQYKLIWRAK